MASPVKSSNCFGIFPADIIVRTAVIDAFRELRAQPWLLDFAFQALLVDELTVREYGAETLETEKRWFLENDVKVTLGYKINNINVPHVAIWFGDQQEADLTTGDVHDTPQETIPWVIAASPVMTFTAAAYDLDAGTVTLPAGKTTESVFAGMRVLDTVHGKAYEILEIIGDQEFAIAAGTQINLTNAQVVNRNGLWNVKLESQANRETFHMDVVVQGDATKCIVLHGLLRWCLQRGKQRLLEGRGFERSLLSSSGLLVAADGDNAAQILFKRTLTLTGITREYWPKDVGAPLQGLGSALVVASGAVEGDIDSLEVAQGWSTVDDDVLGT